MLSFFEVLLSGLCYTTKDSLRHSAANMERAGAVQVLAEDVFSDFQKERQYASDRDSVAHFVKDLLRQDWHALRERPDIGLTEAHLTHITKKTFEVMSDLVLMLVPTTLSHQQPQEKSRSVHLKKTVRFAGPLKWDMDFLETHAEEVMSIITSSFDLNQDSLKPGSKEEMDAGKVLHTLAFTVSSFRDAVQEETADQSEKDQQALDPMESDSDNGYDPLVEDCFFCVYIDRKFWSCIHRFKASFKKKSKKGSHLIVLPQDVTHQLSLEKFQKTSRGVLEEFLQRNYARVSHNSERRHCSQTKVSAVALELLDIVIHSVHELCQPQTACKVNVSEESLREKALDLKNNINVILLRFFTQTDTVVESLEDAQVISKSKLSLFASLLTNRVYSKYYQQAESERQAAQLDPNSMPEVIRPKKDANDIFSKKEAYAFVTETMTCLVKSLGFPSKNSRVNSVSSDPSAQVPDEVTNTDNPSEAEQELLIARLQHRQSELF